MQTTHAAANFATVQKCQFAFLHCWEILLIEPKWQDPKSRAYEKSSAGEGFGEDNIGGDNSSPTREAENRPIGRDQAKAAKKAANSSGGSASSSEYASKMQELSLQRISMIQEDYARKNERFQMLDRIDEQRYVEVRNHNQAMLAIEQDKFRFQQEQYAKDKENMEKQEDERILGINLDACTPAQRWYYEQRQEEILEKMAARRRKRHSPET